MRLTTSALKFILPFALFALLGGFLFVGLFRDPSYVPSPLIGKPAPEFNGAIDSGYITGLGTIKHGDDERMLILMDIEQMMMAPDMGLMDSDASMH